MATVIKQKDKFLTLVWQQNVSQVLKAASIINSENIFVFSSCKLRLVYIGEVSLQKCQWWQTKLYACLGHLGQHNTDRVFSTAAALAKVAKASTILCPCHWHYCPNGSLATFAIKTVCDSDTWQSHDCTCLGHLGWWDTVRIISIWVASPKVTKASTIVTVACHCHWHFCLRMLPMETQLKLPQWKYSFKDLRYISMKYDKSKKIDLLKDIIFET